MVNKIKKLINDQINIHHFDIFDKTGNHIDHKINSGGGHFRSIIVSNDFIDKSLIERHRMVYNALGNMMKNEIHAFSMKTLTVDEYEQQA